MDRFSEMSKQRQLIEEKKQEILKKFSEKRGAKPLTSNNVKQPSESRIQDNNDNVNTNIFKNDGSFLDQFKKFQEIKATSPSTNIKPGIVMKIQPQISKILQPTCAQEQLNSEEQNTEPTVSSLESKAIYIAVEKVAISVAVNGELSEEEARNRHKADPAYAFLHQTDCETYKIYRSRVSDLLEARKRAEADGHLMTFCEKNDLSDSGPSSKKRKKSRWDASEYEVDNNVIPSYVQEDQGLKSYALQVFGSTDLTTEQWKQLEDQRKMRLLYEMMQAKQRENKLRELAGKVKYEYDSDEDIDGGTWEHKKRASEMEKTKNWADELTEHAKGKHHIGDFLPPDELEKFLEKWDAVKQGKTPDFSDYKEHKIASDNIGYQMLQKLGWSEGQGLGADGTGIVEPVNKGATSLDNSGVGQSKPSEIKSEDDEYDAYRKRMMLAYRFRPNPLNNPRRPYY